MAHIWLAGSHVKLCLHTLRGYSAGTVQANRSKSASQSATVLSLHCFIGNGQRKHQSWCLRLRAQRTGKPAGKHHSARCSLLSTQSQSSFRKTATPLLILDTLDRLACPTQHPTACKTCHSAHSCEPFSVSVECRWPEEASKTILLALAAPWEPVHENQEQDWRQRAAVAESKTHWENTQHA